MKGKNIRTYRQTTIPMRLRGVILGLGLWERPTMSNHGSENRVRLDPAVFSLLEEASKLTGMSMRDLASESVRNYLENSVLPAKAQRKVVLPDETVEFWNKQIERVENQLKDLRMHKRMMDLMKGRSGRTGRSKAG
jgi:hypothetical protein